MEVNFSSNKIEINQKFITDLDLFVLEFISILKKHVKYVIYFECLIMFEAIEYFCGLIRVM